MIMLITVLVYFAILLCISRVTSRNADNENFFMAGRRSPWYMVAFGMIGASISGVTFVSVPGMVNVSAMTYLQTCLGFIVGYLVVAFVLLPVYYRLNITTIYAVLEHRMGRLPRTVGATFFIVSKMAGAVVRFYVVCFILWRYVLASLGLPFAVTVCVMVLLIWLYTRRGGIRTLVWTDTFQTFCMLAALVLIIYNVAMALDFSLTDAVRAVAADARSRMFVWDDWLSRQYFWKQFLSGAFIVVVMTGLDQDMMQKNLTCKTLRGAQKDMCLYGMAFFPVNLFFLSLGVLLSMLATQQGMPLPQQGDALLPMFAATGRLGQAVVVMFSLGIVAASFSSADSALTSLTTSCCIDLFRRPSDEALRRRVHALLAVCFAALILLFDRINSTSALDAVYTLCGYTYGPLLGLFAFALLCPRRINTLWVAFVCVASPVVCYVLDVLSARLWDYHFGYELLMLNGLLTFVGLAAVSAISSVQKR